jgi:hypothetical protein
MRDGEASRLALSVAARRAAHQRDAGNTSGASPRCNATPSVIDTSAAAMSANGVSGFRPASAKRRRRRSAGASRCLT